MDFTPPRLSGPSRRNIRLATLLRLRWLSVAGQTIAVLSVYFGLGYSLPISESLIIIAASAWLNIALRLHFRTIQRVAAGLAAAILGFDLAQLTALLFLTGGLENPFSFLLLAPVLISATALPWRMTLLLGAVGTACATLLLFVHLPMPWTSELPLALPHTYVVGIWLSLIVGIGFIGIYGWQIAEEARIMADALSATELVLAREQHLSQLDGLAAAAAHELATPLSTIAVVAKELERSLPEGDPRAEDAALLRAEAERCREILSKLTQLSSGDEPYDRLSLSALVEEVVGPHRDFGIDIEVVRPLHAGDEPPVRRNPSLLYGLGNLVDNAVDFAETRVAVELRWNDKEVAITIVDDGPGFPAEIMSRLGEPYVSSRKRRDRGDSIEGGGLGLGFFIAKTLLERLGASLAMANRPAPDHGAVVQVRWSREDFEQLAER